MASSLESPQLPNLKRNATIAIEKEVKASEVRLDALREDLDSPDKLTIKQIQEVSGKAIHEAEQLKSVLVQQKEAMARLHKDMDALEKRAQKAIQLSALTEPQLEAVKTLITEDAAKHSRWSFVL